MHLKHQLSRASIFLDKVAVTDHVSSSIDQMSFLKQYQWDQTHVT